MARILMAVDGSEHSRRVLVHVLRLKDQFRSGIEVLLLNVQPAIPARDLLLEGRPSEIHRMEEPLRARGAQILEPMALELRGAGVGTQVHVELGDPGELIARFARSYHCDLIVMGTHGVSALAAVCLGSVATRALHFSTVPVLLVP